MKKVVLTVLFVFALSSVGLAAPLTDFSKGKAALDLNYRFNSDYSSSTYAVTPGGNIPDPFGTLAMDADNYLEWGITYGLGNNWALQHRQATPKASFNDAGIVEPPFESKVRTEEYNVMYKLDKNFVLFTGIVKASPSARTAFLYPFNLQGDDKNIWQFGLQATAPLADKFTAYGIAAFGSDYRNWEAGLGYEISKNVELNVNYRDMKIDNLTIPLAPGTSLKHDVKVKGWGFGVTYKF